jgi:hypothetical protein
MAEAVTIRPRIGVPKPKTDPVVETFEKTLDDAPKTKEEETAVKRSTSWEWIIWVVGGIVLLLIIIWFVYPYFIKGEVKPDEVKAAVTDCKVAPDPTPAAKPSQASNDLFKAFTEKKKSKNVKKVAPPEGESPDQPEQEQEQQTQAQGQEAEQASPPAEQTEEPPKQESKTDKVASKLAKNLEN